jgi:hypothetical protein
VERVHRQPEGIAEVPPAHSAGGSAGLPLPQTEELNRLGELREIYTPDPSSRRRNARLLWAGIAVGLLGLAPVIVAWATGDFKKNGAAAVAGLLLSALFLPWCGWRLRQLARGSRARILVFTDGLARFDGPGLATCRWDEIETVQGVVKTYRVDAATVGTRFIITIKFGASKELRIDGAKDHLAGMDVLYQRLCSETGRHLLPRCYTAIEAGQTVTFGVLGISKLGLHWGRHVLAWNDTENIDFQDGLRIRNPNTWPLHPWVRLVDFAIPNHVVFLRLAEHYVKDNGRGSVPPWTNPQAPQGDHQ